MSAAGSGPLIGGFPAWLSSSRPGDARAEAPPPDLPTLLRRLESDRGRIVHSAAIRRLQQKTQVFPLERNAAVRSRLTHSLEVQQTGRYIVRTLFERLGAQAGGLGLAGLQGALETLVEMGCLMHDIGNPPFGHFGEFAIAEWFQRELDSLFAAVAPGDSPQVVRMREDLKNFEGNAQALRLVVRLLRLNLTYCQTAVLVKYVRPAYAPRPAPGTPGAYRARKPGFYLSEANFMTGLREALGLEVGCRHPLVYIMEAADDIAYCLADIEDSVEKGILGLEQVERLLLDCYAHHRPLDEPIGSDGLSFGGRVAQAVARAGAEPINKVGEFFISLRVSMVHPLVEHAAEQFIEHFPAISEGRLDRALLEDGSAAHAIVRTFKDVAARNVFCHAEVETLHLQGYRILQGLLDHYAPLLRLDAQRFEALVDGEADRSPHLSMLVRRLPNQLLKAYREAVRSTAATASDQAAWEFYHRCRLLQDFVSGMTDQLAHDEYRTLSVS